jgi:hypothetical protein
VKQAQAKKHPVHFDTFGNLHHVLEAIDYNVPRLFKGEDVSFIPTLKTTIRMHALQHKWDVIVLSLSKGMARQELDVILNHMPEHLGPLVVDATASTPEHESVYNETLLLTRKERIIRLNDETSDVMIVLYGLKGLDAPMERKLLMKRFHYMGTTLDMMLERNEDIEGGAREEGITGTLQKALLHIRSIYAHDASEESKSVVPIAAAAFMALAAVIMAYKATHSEHLRAQLDIISSELKELPGLMKVLNFTYEPFIKAAEALKPEPMMAEPALTPHAPDLQSKPEQHKPTPDHHGYEHLIPKMEPR